MSHPQPAIQASVSQNFRGQQQQVGEGVSNATARLWNAGFSIKEARDSWETMRPAFVMLCYRYYNASLEAGKTYYDACRVTAGLGPLPATVKVKIPTLDSHHIGRVIDPCGLGAFLHQVKQGDMMMDAFTSARKTLCAAVATLIQSGARDYVQAASDADPASRGVRRVTKGTCGYCEHLADMGAKVPPGGWHADCDCTNEPTFGTDTGPSPSLPKSDTGSIGVQEASWNKTVEYVGNSLKSGNLKDAQEFLNPDGSLNESKAITHLIEQHKADEPYSLSASGKPLNNTQTKLLDKFFTKLTGTKKNMPLPNKKASKDPVKEAQKNLDAAVQALMNNPMDQPDNIGPLQDKLAEADKALADAKKLAKGGGPKPSAADMVDDYLDKEADLYLPGANPTTPLEKAHALLDKAEDDLEKVKLKKADVLFSPTSEQEKVAEEYKVAKQKFKDAHKALTELQDKQEPTDEEKIAEAQEKLTAAEKDLIAKENIKTNIPFWDKETNSGAPYDKAVKDWEDAKNAHFQAAQHLQFLKEQAEKANPTPSAEHTPLTKAELKALDDGIKEWKTSSSIQRQKIQQELIKALSGKPGSNARIRAITRAFQEQSEDAPQLFRGLSWSLDDPYDKPQWDAMKAILDQGPGARFDLPPSSFSEGEEWPTKFMAMKDASANVRKMKIILQDGAQGINIEDLGVKQGELEWLTGGKFELVSMGKHGNSFNIVIKQVAGLDKPVTLKQPESKAFISAVTSWKGSSVTLSKQIDTILKGNPGTGPAQVIVDYLRTNTEPAPPLYRGLKFYQYGSDKNAAALAFDKANEPGKDVYLPAASFSKERSVGTSFAGGAHEDSTMVKFMYELVGGKGVDIMKTGGTMLHEKEWITGGIFHIKSRQMIDGIMHIYVDQLATLVE